MNHLLSLLITLFIASCHPLALFRPPMPKPAVLRDERPKPLTIAVDVHGIPFIKALNLENAMYGLALCMRATGYFSLM